VQTGPAPTDHGNANATGKVLRADGSPLTGKVALVRAETFGDFFWGLASLGLTCLAEAGTTGQCQQVQTTTVDSSGGYSFTVAQADTYGTFIVRYPIEFQVLATGTTAQGQTAPAWVAESFDFDSIQVALPSLQLWEPTVTASQAAGVWNVSLDSPVPSPPACFQPGQAQLLLENAGTTVWTQAATSGNSFDARIIEDLDVTAAVVVKHVMQGDYWISYGSAKVPVTGPGAPPSRKAACQIDGTSFSAGACALTDGQMQASVAVNGSAVLDLGTARAVNLVIVRSTGTSAAVESSSDNATWTRVGTIAAPFAATSPATSVQARYVRVTAPAVDAGQSLTLSQVSVW
jgi:hypothetical protein